MLISQKCQYALRAIFELTKRRGQGPIKIAEIATAQNIPQRFLEVILHQLKQGGFVTSQRGKHGGYLLQRRAKPLMVGEVIRFIQGPIGPVDCMNEQPCPLRGNCAFLPLWERVQHAVSEIYDHTSFEDLVHEEMQKAADGSFHYSI